MLIYRCIEERVRQAVVEILPDANLDEVQVRPCPDSRFGDYQTTALMALAKSRRLNPRQLATEVTGKLDVSSWCASVEIAGAGFLNFRLDPEALGRSLEETHRRGTCFVEPAGPSRTVVVDFSSPNVAKPMHVGHIRSTLLGDCLARIQRLLGHRVITDNHIGDWGTQFGKLLVGWKRSLDPAALDHHPLAEMERLYRETHEASERDPSILEAARQELVRLQSGDEENLRIWREMITWSRREFDQLYQRLGVRFDHTLGESHYNPRLQSVVEDLRLKGLARESEGAVVAFFDDHPKLKAHPAIIRKRDGAANYTTTDLATLQYRLETWAPDEIIYVTDGRQQLHFQQLFELFRRWYPQAKVELAHVWFGSILGEDGRPFRTRSGETVKLAELLDEAEERALVLVREKNPALSETDQREIARIVGLGAIKYSDLLPNRQSDYAFSWEKMLAFNGNTAPYLQYAYTRIQSIFRKGGYEAEAGPGLKSAINLSVSHELALAKHLLNFGLVLEQVAQEYRPNYLCNYLYELAGLFTAFYENCPVLKAVGAARDSRLVLCELAGRVLKQGLNALGIEVLEQM